MISICYAAFQPDEQQLTFNNLRNAACTFLFRLGHFTWVWSWTVAKALHIAMWQRWFRIHKTKCQVDAHIQILKPILAFLLYQNKTKSTQLESIDIITREVFSRRRRNLPSPTNLNHFRSHYPETNLLENSQTHNTKARTLLPEWFCEAHRYRIIVPPKYQTTTPEFVCPSNDICPLLSTKHSPRGNAKSVFKIFPK